MIQDYRCYFHIRERVGDNWPEEQVIAIRFRESPYSVEMRWVHNPQGAKRISYVAGRWISRGRQLALIIPSGLAGVLVPLGVKLDIHGPEVRAASTRSIDQFGFLRTLDRIIDVSKRAAGQADYELRFVGEGTLDDRPSLVLERKLPYEGPSGRFPDRSAVMYIDREFLVPLGVWTYADDAKSVPLGSFVTTSVEFNVGLGDSDFE